MLVRLTIPYSMENVSFVNLIKSLTVNNVRNLTFVQFVTNKILNILSKPENVSQFVALDAHNVMPSTNAQLVNQDLPTKMVFVSLVILKTVHLVTNLIFVPFVILISKLLLVIKNVSLFVEPIVMNVRPQESVLLVKMVSPRLMENVLNVLFRTVPIVIKLIIALNVNIKILNMY